MSTSLFAETIRQRVSPEIRSYLEAFEGFVEQFEQFAEKVDTLCFAPEEDLRLLHNNYVDMIRAVYLVKTTALCKSLADSVNRLDFLAYALIGRSLIEHAANFRYFFREQIAPLVKADASPEDMEAFRKLCEVHIRGTRFDWHAFLVKNFEKMKAEVREKLKAGSNAPKASHADSPRPVPIKKCIDAWGKETPAVVIAYDLFCDLVHPNVGSNFLTMTVDGYQFRIRPNSVECVAFTIFEDSFPLLLACSLKEIAWLLAHTLLLKYQDDELPPGVSGSA